ncbi:hypothetical protein M5689_015387 [Euphorbia peplus]|nr:hypothetical protein M5689_015387 [Euphorbia peplus]
MHSQSQVNFKEGGKEQKHKGGQTEQRDPTDHLVLLGIMEVINRGLLPFTICFHNVYRLYLAISDGIHANQYGSKGRFGSLCSPKNAEQLHE